MNYYFRYCDDENVVANLIDKINEADKVVLTFKLSS